MATSKPSKERVAEEIKKLQELKPRVRHYSIFNDDNHAAVDAQIEVLKGELDMTSDEAADLPETSRSAADEAQGWLDTGETTDGDPDLVTGWQGLLA